MKRNYDECVTKYSDSFVRVVLDPGYVSRIQNFVTELVEAKAKEDHHKIDSNKEVKRFTTGFLGEAALEKLFGIFSCGLLIRNSTCDKVSSFMISGHSGAPKYPESPYTTWSSLRINFEVSEFCSL